MGVTIKLHAHVCVCLSQLVRLSMDYPVDACIGADYNYYASSISLLKKLKYSHAHLFIFSLVMLLHHILLLNVASSQNKSST